MESDLFAVWRWKLDSHLTSGSWRFLSIPRIELNWFGFAPWQTVSALTVKAALNVVHRLPLRFAYSITFSFHRNSCISD